MSDLIVILDAAARQTSQRVPPERMDDLVRLSKQAPAAADQAQLQWEQAWAAADLAGKPVKLQQPQPAQLPFVVWSSSTGWLLVNNRSASGVWTALEGSGSESAVQTLDSLERFLCMSLPQKQHVPPPEQDIRAIDLVREAVDQRKRVFIDAVAATALVNLLTLAISLFSMQVYDRVIPNGGLQTLWVLTVGTVVALILEFTLKQVRSRTIDGVCMAIDHQLSSWFFARMMSIRMEKRPGTVGTLASQVKGFETVRGVLTSTSLFVLADVPFALFFVLIIALVGGWLAVVPLLILPIALFAGVMFQRAIQRLMRQNMTASNKKTGLLVEAVDGAEAFKASGAEWKLQSRWNQLVHETGETDQQTRNYSVLSQNLTASIQQLGYVILVAAGAYLVSENKLTMGALLACTIISNRALMPVVQLPGMMVQWAQAQAAMEGLDKIIALPSEDDDQHQALMPGKLEGDLRFERVRFAYPGANRVALELEQMSIRPGERVGLVGSIGSGKSTLLKMASGLYRPSEGKVFLGGVDVALLSNTITRENIGYLPQDVRLISGTLRDNLLLGIPDPGDEAILAAAQRTGLSELITSQPKGLALEISEGSRGVSGGQKQLIAITRMLLSPTRIWLLDEPTGAMDAVSEARIVALLKELSDQGVTMLIATHKTALIPLLERLVVVHQGRVVLDGPRNVVLEKISGRAATPAQGGMPAGVSV
jgi:ATP-binding cassette, subfamily C, bacterial LapB